MRTGAQEHPSCTRLPWRSADGATAACRTSAMTNPKPLLPMRSGTFCRDAPPRRQTSRPQASTRTDLAHAVPGMRGPERADIGDDHRQNAIQHRVTHSRWTILVGISFTARGQTHMLQDADRRHRVVPCMLSIVPSVCEVVRTARHKCQQSDTSYN